MDIILNVIHLLNKSMIFVFVDLECNLSNKSKISDQFYIVFIFIIIKIFTYLGLSEDTKNYLQISCTLFYQNFQAKSRVKRHFTQ